jgi:hypothetical protein
MDKKRLLSYGYLFKELPPPFTSVSFGNNCDLIIGLTYSTTRCIEYSIPKGQYARRLLHLPHPSNYFRLVDFICDPANWNILKTHYRKTAFSHSGVIENTEAGSFVLSKNNRAIKTNYDRLGDSKESTIIDSYDMLYELKLDISKYYPSIYSHSFTWAILGKERAKKLWRLKGAKAAEPDYDLYKYADTLDTYIRSCQDDQTVGIPIGPDSSHILSEIIGTYIDDQLKLKFPEIKVSRFFDDFYIYVETEEKAQVALKFLQQILAEFQLTINESKLRIQKFPFPFQDSWVQEIGNSKIEKVNKESIKRYFNTLFTLAQRYTGNSSTILSYGLRTFEKRSTEIPESGWEVFEALLLKCMLIEPSILDVASRIFETYKPFLSKKKINEVLKKILQYHCELNHHFETVWALWIYKQLRLKLSMSIVKKIINTNDNFSILMLLDLNSKGLIEDGPITAAMMQEISDILDLGQTENWLLYYEAVEVKKWITATKRPEFDPLVIAGISFYDLNAEIKTFDPPKKKVKKANI